MPRSEVRMQLNCWREGLAGLDAHQKLLYWVVASEKTVNHAGVGIIRIEWWADNASLTDAETRKALDGLADSGHVHLDWDTHEVLVRTLIRHDKVAEQPYMLKSAIASALATESRRLRWVLAQELRKLPPKPADGTSKAGRKIVYPDPHAAADLLDPPGSEPPPGIGPKPFRDPSETHSDGIGNPGSPKPFRDPLEREGGRGGGGGGGKSLSVGGSDLSATSADVRESLGFDEFWQRYPRKEKRQDAERAWRTHVVKRRVYQRTVYDALEAHVRHWRSRYGDDTQYVPLAPTWLRGERWNDELDAALSVVPDIPALDSVDEYLDNAAGQDAARVLGIAYVPDPQPPSDRTPPRDWEREAARRWITHHADALRERLEQLKDTG